jgi:hypothetical protein
MIVDGTFTIADCVLRSTALVGWDPETEKIVSLQFSTFGPGQTKRSCTRAIWATQGDKWVRTKVDANGKAMSTSVITLVDSDTHLCEVKEGPFAGQKYTFKRIRTAGAEAE